MTRSVQASPAAPDPDAATGAEPASQYSEREIEASMAYCHAVARREAKNFYYGMKLTPEPRRSALYAVYAFMRACDDLVDEAPGIAVDPVKRRKAVGAFRQRMDRVLAGDRFEEEPFWPAFESVCRRYPVRPADLHAMLDGQLDDLRQHRYATFEDLYGYCYRVASVVGLVCVAIWGYDGDASTLKLAEHRGIALQLTNILRDVVEDAQRDRVYLPREDFERFGLDPKALSQPESLLASPAAFDRFMMFQVERAKGFYAMSEPLESRLSPESRRACWTMMRIYRGILDRVAADPRRVLTGRVRLGKTKKLGVVMRAMCGKF